MSGESDLRVSDEDRERLASDLREHFAAGRLSDEDLGDRLEAVYRARTQGELEVVRADLPSLPATPAQQRAELSERRGELGRELLQQTGGGLVPFVICTAIWVAAGAHGAFWPAWVALAALIPLLANLWRLYGPAPELDRVESDLDERSERPERRAGRREPRRLER